MATWVELSVDACKAARLLRDKHHRSAVSRAYYAAYSAVTSELRKDRAITFGFGRNNPEHGRLLDYVQQSFSRRGFAPQSVNQFRRDLRDLRRDRERADYLPHENVGENDALENLKRAEKTLYELGLPL